MPEEPKFPAAWQRSVLPLLLLAQLRRGPAHGYALAKALASRGLDPLKGATLYPALAKLEADGLVSTSWEQGQGGPGRKVYELSGAGRSELAHQSMAFAAFSGIVRGASAS